MNKLMTLAVVLFLPLLVVAQQKTEVGILLGGTNYQGDISSSKLFSFKGTQVGGGLYVRYHLNRHISLRGTLLYTKLQGDDLNFVDEAIYRRERAFNFSNPLFEFSFTPEWYILGNMSKRARFKPYLFAGIGAAFTNPETNLPAAAVENEPGHYPTNHFSFPIGGGVNFDVNDRMTLGLEASSHFPITDYLDGISESGNPDARDWFVFGGVTLGYKIGEDIPKIVDTDGDGVQDDQDQCPLVAGDLAGCPDADQDGVADIKDACPTLAGEEGLNGCPDTDTDGIADINDECPTVNGLASMNGCPDMDADGIADIKDKCPNLAGTLTSKGCPDDTDGDGIYDTADDCPTVAGKLNGCPDSDADGIADRFDNCPNVAGMTSMNGCPDTDGDGVADVYDNCPDKAGITSNKGCPEVLVSKGESENMIVYLVDDVYFQNTRAKITEQEFAKLNEVVELLKSNPNYNLQIKGHTDDTGDLDLNEHLSMRRARRCYKYLASKGIAISRMSFKGLGATQPKYDNSTEAGKSKNRRVEFAFLK